MILHHMPIAVLDFKKDGDITSAYTELNVYTEAAGIGV